MTTMTRTLTSVRREQSLPNDILSPMECQEWNEMLKEHQQYVKQVQDAFQALVDCHEKKVQYLNNWRDANRSLAVELNDIQEEFSNLQRQWQASHRGRSRKGSKNSDSPKDQSRSRPYRSLRECTRNQLNCSTHQNSSTPNMPTHLLCPLTHEPFVDPVVDHEGNTYEKEAILEWLAMNPTSPITRKYLRKDQLIPNRAVKQAVDCLAGSTV